MAASEPCIDVFTTTSGIRSSLVLAVRRTDPSFVGDLKQNLTLFRERVKAFVEGPSRHYLPQYATTLLTVMTEWEKRHSECQLYLTGHSLEVPHAARLPGQQTWH